MSKDNFEADEWTPSQAKAKAIVEFTKLDVTWKKDLQRYLSRNFPLGVNENTIQWKNDTAFRDAMQAILFNNLKNSPNFVNRTDKQDIIKERITEYASDNSVQLGLSMMLPRF